MRIFVWLIRAAIFFVLFAFAMNNQHEVDLRWFFGRESRAPMVFIVLGAFALGCALGVFAMVPSWWRHRRVAKRHTDDAPLSVEPQATAPAPESMLPAPPRDGL